MKVGFYYHNTFLKKNNRIYVPGYIGVFIDALASEVEQLYIFLEEQKDTESQEEDYCLQKPNIKLISLGKKTTFYARLLIPNKQVDIITSETAHLDSFLIRMPSPLAPHIYNKIRNNIQVTPLVVGNYVTGLKNLKQPFIRKIGIIVLTYYYQWLENKMLNNAKILVNSGALFNTLKQKVKSISLVKTTTLNEANFYKREDTCIQKKIYLLYTGRINFQKGLRELVSAVGQLKDSYDLNIDIVGWEEKGSFSYIEAINKQASELGISDRVVFHGKKTIGPELDSYYRKADIYVIPSYHEGFPRTIWEAMANSLPVIATKVGSIPYFLSEKHAKLIAPKSIEELKLAIEETIINIKARRSQIQEAYALAKECTLERQTKLLVEIMKGYQSN
ncbi:MAG: glycosyltransferase family 4 protein [Bacteroidia bacterium]|jgi:glycosyltransferase involved in cell wall biosynthesis|nr:glycosyltransferase family 4 protein [Bacteroidia bacterium]